MSSDRVSPGRHSATTCICEEGVARVSGKSVGGGTGMWRCPAMLVGPRTVCAGRMIRLQRKDLWPSAAEWRQTFLHAGHSICAAFPDCVKRPTCISPTCSNVVAQCLTGLRSCYEITDALLRRLQWNPG